MNTPYILAFRSQGISHTLSNKVYRSLSLSFYSIVICKSTRQGLCTVYLQQLLSKLTSSYWDVNVIYLYHFLKFLSIIINCFDKNGASYISLYQLVLEFIHFPLLSIAQNKFLTHSLKHFFLLTKKRILSMCKFSFLFFLQTNRTLYLSFNSKIIFISS